MTFREELKEQKRHALYVVWQTAVYHWEHANEPAEAIAWENLSNRLEKDYKKAVVACSGK